MIEVRYRVRPFGSIEYDLVATTPSSSQKDGDARVNRFRTSSSEDAGGFVYSCGKS